MAYEIVAVDKSFEIGVESVSDLDSESHVEFADIAVDARFDSDVDLEIMNKMFQVERGEIQWYKAIE
jgi:hypothetical protein